jgi:hypothetical protein
MTPAEFDAALAELVEDEAEREPYDPSDEHDYFNDDWEMDR